MTVRIAWGAKVSQAFLDQVVWMVNDLDIGDDTLDGTNKMMTCMAWESGRTFDPKKKNLAGSGATGLIQFMPNTAVALGTTTARLAKMTAEQQLNYVWQYFAPYKGKLKTLADIYMAILWPKGVGKPETYILWDRNSKPTTYRQNAGLDKNKDAVITKAEAASKVAALLTEGLKPGNVWEGELPDGFRDDPAPAQIVRPEIQHVPPAPAEMQSLPPAIQDVVQSGEPVALELDTPESTTTVVVAPKTTTNVIHDAISGLPGTLAGTAAVAGALLLNPEFAAALGRFTTNLANGQGSWGALMTLIGLGLIVYRRKTGP